MNSNVSSLKTRSIETYINRETAASPNIKGFLRAVGFVHDNEDIVDFKLGNLGTETIVPLTFTVKKQKEVVFIRHNG